MNFTRMASSSKDDGDVDIELVNEALKLNLEDVNKGERSNQKAEPSYDLSPDVVVCDDEESLQKAISELQSCTTLVLDCEGNNLGVDGGALSLICIRTVTIENATPKTYLFDAVRVKSLTPLYSILSSNTVQKIVYDGRMDFCALWYGYRVTLPNTIDLQLVDILSRKMKGETEEMQMKSLMRFFPPAALKDPRKRQKYLNLHILLGLGGCLTENKVGAGEKGSVDHHSWMERPLSKKHLFYAANDVKLISRLLQHFEAAQYLGSNMDTLLAQSARYISIWSDFQPTEGDKYRSHPFLQLEILHYEARAPKKQCDGCKRNLSQNSFPDDSWSRGNTRFCHVCTMIPTWKRRMDFFDRRRQEEKEKKRLKKMDAQTSGAQSTTSVQAQNIAVTPTIAAAPSISSGGAGTGTIPSQNATSEGSFHPQSAPAAENKGVARGRRYSRGGGRARGSQTYVRGVARGRSDDSARGGRPRDTIAHPMLTEPSSIPVAGRGQTRGRDRDQTATRGRATQTSSGRGGRRGRGSAAVP